MKIRRPTREEVWLRAVMESSRLGPLVAFAYNRFDGDDSVGRTKFNRRFWELVGDWADEARCAWYRRPKVER